MVLLYTPKSWVNLFQTNWKTKMSEGTSEQEHHSHHAAMADEHIGALIRVRRQMMGLTQQDLAKGIGITYQQLHKYERGLNRISAGRLFDVAQVLHIEPGWFFEGMLSEAAHEDLPPRQRLHLELIRNFMQIKDERQQDAICHMARTLAAV